MTNEELELIKAANAEGSKRALLEAGYAEKVAHDESAAYTNSVFEKDAISPQLAERALAKMVKRIPGKVQGGLTTPHEMFLARMGGSGRTISRAAKGLQVPVPRGEKEWLMEAQLKRLLKQRTPGYIGDLVPAGVPKRT